TWSSHLLLQNMGIVCRHYFMLMRRVPKCPYHISLIPRRWFHESLQGIEDPGLAIEPFRYCTVFEGEPNTAEEVAPADNYMGFVRDILPARASQPLLSREEATEQYRYSNIAGMIKSIADIASDDRESQGLVENEFKRLLLLVRAKKVESIPVENPMDPVGSGWPKVKRL
ncbi:hypothetical protein BGX34_006549, partial [Mortierella sp. NVP85]